MKGLGNIIGIGKVILRGKGKQRKPVYSGTMPTESKPGDEVITVLKSDLELILKNHQVLLFQSKVEMGKEFYDLETKAERIFPDEIRSPNKSKKIVRLFLDRHWYTLNPGKYLWVRYCSVEAALSEGEIDGSRGDE